MLETAGHTDEQAGRGAVQYRFVLDKALKLAGCEQPRLLDFGCGRGQVVAAGLARGLDIVGVDTYAAHYDAWRRDIAPACAARIARVEDGRIPHPDNSFDVVIANQVFEHIPDPRAPLREIARVLKPGGALLAIYPDQTCWYEGHAGVFFVQWFERAPQAQFALLYVAHRLGFGYYRGVCGSGEWARETMRNLQRDVVHHRPGDMRRWMRSAFGAAPVSHAPDYVAHRLAASPRLARFAGLARSPALRPLIEALCARAAGRVVAVRKEMKENG